jgi:subtilisin-like proprotein convertase family protein
MRLLRALAPALALAALPVAALADTHLNPAAITIPDASPATTYPSTIGVAGEGTSAAKVTVSLNEITHTYPDDLDILLVGPTGANAIIMSDVCGQNRNGPFSVTIDDDAPAAMLDESVVGCPSATYQPTNNGPIGPTSTDVWPAPAPTPSGSTSLAAFEGVNPNGTWQLFVVDDFAGDVGSIAGGWALNISSTPTSVAVRSFAAAQVGRQVVVRWRVAPLSHVLGFHVYRSSRAKTVRLNSALIAADGTELYRLVDRRISGGRSYTYRLQVVKPDGSRAWYGSSSLTTR